MSGRVVLLDVVVKSGFVAEHLIALAAAELGFPGKVVRLRVVRQVLFVVERLGAKLARKLTFLISAVVESDVFRELVEVRERCFAELAVEGGLMAHLNVENYTFWGSM